MLTTGWQPKLRPEKANKQMGDRRKSRVINIVTEARTADVWMFGVGVLGLVCDITNRMLRR